MSARDLQDDLRSALAALADPERAVAQQRYMKSEMPCYGVGTAAMRQAARAVFAVHPLPDAQAWRAAAELVWREAEHREERYAVIGLLRYPAYRAWASDPGNLPMLKEFVVTGAWWDLVDDVAAHCVGAVLRAHRAEVTPVIRAWSREDHLWVRRTAILSQLTFKDSVDADLLAYAIEGSISDTDFFARKAIGWALRSYARGSDEAADWVRAFVAANADRLSGLSKREALKHL